MSRIFIRSEPFGGVVVDLANERLIFVDRFGFEAMSAFSKGLSSDRIAAVAFARLPTEDHQTALARINAINSFVSYADRSPGVIRLCSGDIEGGIPTLSAPLDLYWEITRRCNENCLHCYNNSSPSGFNPDIKHLDSIMEELSPYKLKNITLTGGEPMMRRDFWYIADRLRPRTYELTMGTNSTLINEENFERIGATFDTLNISLDDPSPSEFDRFRAYRGAFAKTVRALKLVSGTDVTINIQTVLTRESASRLDLLGDLLTEFRVDNWIVRFAFESGRARSGAEYLSGQEIFDMSDEMLRIKNKYQTDGRSVIIGANYPWSYKQEYSYVAPTEELQTCAAATTHAAIDAFGRMAPCSLFTETTYKTKSVFGGSFIDTWRTAAEFESMRRLRRRDVKGCGTCSNAAGICGGGCRAKAYMRFDTILKNDYSCNYS